MDTQAPAQMPLPDIASQPRTVVGSMWRQAHYEAARKRLGRALCAAGEAALDRQVREQRERVAELKNAAETGIHQQQVQWLDEVRKLFVAGVAHVLAVEDPRTIEPVIRPLLPSASDTLAMAARETGEVSETALARVGVRSTMTAVVDVLPSLIETGDDLMEARGA